MNRYLGFRWYLLILLLTPLAGQDFSKLPDWARLHAAAAQVEPAPVEADAWVLFDRTEVAYVGDGEIRTRRLRLVKILSERGLSEGSFAIQGLGGKSGEVKKLKGWNLRSDGDLTRLDEDRVWTNDNASQAEVSTATLTTATLPRLAKGSLVAFESLQIIRHPMGPVADAWVPQVHPIRRWELEPAKKEGWFTNLKRVEIRVDRRHFEPWLTHVSSLGDQGVAVDKVPGLPKDELDHPSMINVIPQVYVRFLDPDLRTTPPWGDWDAFATWVQARYAENQDTVRVEGVNYVPGKEGLESLTSWMNKELQYRQIYLSPERGWIPLTASEVRRRKYGDCKDLSCFLIAQAQKLGWEAYPVLARIVDGEVEIGGPPSLATFNHAICAIRLERSLGLPAEVDLPKGRFLLIDPTDRFTPLGFLGSAHAGGRVLICTAEGGQWAQVPPAAILPSKVVVSLQGEADQRGVLKATLKIEESGDGWFLRAVVQQLGLKKTRTFLLTKILDLPPTASFEITRVGDPLDRLRPFVIEMDIRHPEGFRASGHEACLAALGWRIVPNPIQKPGVSRRYPVSHRKEAEFEFSGVIKVPGRYAPILPSKEGDTPFRAFSWSAKADEDGAGTLLTLHLQHQAKEVFFDYDHRDDGIAAAKKDRSLVKNLVADGLSFKALP